MRKPLIGLLLGLLLGLVDWASVELLFVTFSFTDRDLTPFVAILLTVNLGGLGYVIGMLWEQRVTLRTQAELITEQVHELEATQKQLVEHETLAAIGRMAAGVAHEVRNPLGVIRGSAKMVLEDLEQGSDSAQAADFIVHEVDQLNDFVTQLLDFSRPIDATSDQIMLADVATDVVGAMGPLATEKGIDVTFDGRDDVTVNGDAGLMSQLLRGLVGNALEDAEQHISIRVGPGSEEVVVDVVDDGPGVAEEHVHKIFEPFFTTRANGTGLGLAMAQKIADVHGATLEYVTGRGLGDAGAGACFRLRIPA